MPGLTAIAVPIFDINDQVPHCLALTGPSVRMDPRDLDLAEIMMTAGRDISTRLGASPEHAIDLKLLMPTTQAATKSAAPKKKACAEGSGQDAQTDGEAGRLKAAARTAEGALRGRLRHSGFANVLPLFDQPLQQRCRLPELAVLALEVADARVDLVQAHRVGVEHRPAAPGRKAVAVDVDQVDVGRALGNAFLEDLRAFVHQRVDRALDDLLVADRAALDAGLLRASR